MRRSTWNTGWNAATVKVERQAPLHGSVIYFLTALLFSRNMYGMNNSISSTFSDGKVKMNIFIASRLIYYR